MNTHNDQVIDFIRSQFASSSASTSKYEGLCNAIKIAIEEDILLPGSTLPGERKLADLLDISRITVRNAIDELVSDGQLVRRHGARTSVSEKVRKQISNLVGFSEDIRSRGMTPGARLLSAESVEANEAERARLKLGPGDRVIRLHRVRLANDRPIALERAAIPHSVVKSPDAIGPSLYATLDALGMSPQRGFQKITAKIMDEEEAELLETKVGAPALVIERCCETASGIPIEYTLTCYNAEAFDFSNELQR